MCNKLQVQRAMRQRARSQVNGGAAHAETSAKCNWSKRIEFPAVRSALAAQRF